MKLFRVMVVAALIAGGAFASTTCKAKPQEAPKAGMTATTSSATAPQAADVDARFPSYKKTTGVSGSIKSVGSDTMNNLMTLWCEGFKKLYPNVVIGIEGKGSGTAPTALTAGTSNFGPMSREMKKEEAEAFEKKYGYKPVAFPTAIDCLAVYVPKDNPIKGLTLPQLDAIFSKTRKLGFAQDVTNWGVLGLDGEWKERPLSVYGRNSASGTYGYFKEHVLGKGDFKDSVKEQPGSSSVVQGIASDKGGIGYSGMGYKTADVRIVPLAKADGQPFVDAEPKNAYNGTYPLARPLLIYVNAKPNTELEPLRREFLKYIFSKEGQAVVIKDGFLPLPYEMAKDALKQIGIEIDATAKN